MDENKYIARIKGVIPENGDVPNAVIELVDQAVRDFPMSVQLWILRGDLIQLGPLNSPYNLNDALLSYRKALEIDPSNIEAHEQIGHYFDAAMGDEAEAKKWFKKAEKMKKQR